MHICKATQLLRYSPKQDYTVKNMFEYSFKTFFNVETKRKIFLNCIDKKSVLLYYIGFPYTQFTIYIFLQCIQVAYLFINHS